MTYTNFYYMVDYILVIQDHLKQEYKRTEVPCLTLVAFVLTVL